MTTGGVPERLVRATIGLLAEQGPSAIKARTVAEASGLSTMAVYTHFGRIPELLRAVVDQGFKELDRAIAQVPVTDDPVADLSAMALAGRQFARQNPHLYDLMFGLSTRRATYRPLPDSDLRFSGRSPAFHRAYVRLHAACQRLVSSGRARRLEPEVRLDQLAVGIGERGASTVYAGARNPDTTPAVRAEVLDGPCIGSMASPDDRGREGIVCGGHDHKPRRVPDRPPG